MFKKNRGILFFSFFILVVFFVSADSESSPEASSQAAAEGGSQETREFFLTETEAGQTKWDIRASSAEFSSGGTVHLKKVKINFYEGGEKFLNVKADQGHYNNIEKNVHLEGNVIGITNRGENFITQSLDWISSERKIRTRDKIKLTGQNMVVNAQGIELSPDLKKVILKKNIKAEIYGGNKDFPFNFGR